MKKILLSSMVTMLSCLALSVANAEINFRGFGSFVGGIASDDEPVAGYADDLDFRLDSLIALQAEAEVDENVSATIQFVSRGADRYDVDVEWAYLTYHISDSQQISVGRIRYPFYRYSDYLDVRYAYNWVKAPSTVYGFEFPGFDGVSYLNNFSIGSWDSTVQVIFGHLDGEIDLASVEGASPAIFHKSAGINVTTNKDWFTFRIGYILGNPTIELTLFEELFSQIEQLGQAGVPGVDNVLEAMDIDDDRGPFFATGFSIDYNDWLAEVEYVNYKVEDSLFPETTAYFVMFGKRIGSFVPSITYSEATAKDPVDVLAAIDPAAAAFNVPIGVNPATNMPITVPFPTFIGAAVQNAARSQEQTAIHANLRWDISGSSALKFSYEIFDLELEEDDRSLFRIGIDFVF